MKKLLIFILPLLGLLGGGAAGAMLRTAPESGISEEGGHDAKAAESGHGAAPQAGDHGGATADKDGLAWFRFPSQFFVPIIRNSRPEAVMVLTLTIETTKTAEQNVFAKEHRLRDALLRQLLIHANTGGFDGNFTSDAHMTELRSKLLKAATEVAGSDVRDVLIEDLARQAQ